MANPIVRYEIKLMLGDIMPRNIRVDEKGRITGNTEKRGG